MKTVGLCLEPLDVLFFRDGRPFGAATRASSGLPMPQTVAGAVRTALLEKYGGDFNRLRGAPDFAAGVGRACPDQAWIAEVACRGPWLARWKNEERKDWEVLVPMPATLHSAKEGTAGRLYRLGPLSLMGQLPGWRLDEQHGLRPLWLRERVATEAAAGYLTPAGLGAFLRNEEVSAGEVVPRDKLFDFDHRTGIGIDADRLTAGEGEIYGASFLALKECVWLYAEMVLPDDAPPDALRGIVVLPLGGEGRRARLKELPRFDWPLSEREGKPLLLLTTPGVFREGWRPACLNQLAAAAVPGSLAVSGWDLARRGPKPTRFAAAAGSVYFLDGVPDGLPPDSLADDAEDRLLGWGCYLKGAWKDA